MYAGNEESLLQVEGLTVKYGGSVLAVDGVSFRVAQGVAVALVGANGAGKTTVLRAIGGLLGFHRGAITAGRVRFAGKTVKGGNPAKLVAAGLAQTLEGRRIFSALTLAQNLRLGAFTPRARKLHDETLAGVVQLFPRLGDRLDQPGGTLSGGEQQMLAIGRAMMARPRLLMLDEPSMGLAPIVVSEIAVALRRIVDEGTAVLLVDQNTALARSVATHACLLVHGRLEASGPAPDLLGDQAVQRSYLGMAAERR